MITEKSKMFRFTQHLRALDSFISNKKIIQKTVSGLILTCFFSFFFLSVGNRTAAYPVPAPLYQDPAYFGSTDPEIIWNHNTGEWWIFYTCRRATLKGGMTWAGNAIGVAVLKEKGQWKHLGYCRFDNKGGEPDSEDTYWAPGIIRENNTYHMFVTFKKGRPVPFTGTPHIIHYTAGKDLLNGWEKAGEVVPPQKSIDAALFKVNNRYRLWHKMKGKINLMVSPDLKAWNDEGLVKGDVNKQKGIEGPYVFFWKNSFWMITDPHNGIQVYQSIDNTETWKHKGTILLEPGIRPLDNSRGRHASVAVVNDRAFIFYHVEPERDYVKRKSPLEKTIAEKICALQMAEIELVNGKIQCDRNRPIQFPLFTCSSLTAEVKRDHTSYPIYGILQVHPDLDDKEARIEGKKNFAILEQFQFIYTGDRPPLRMVRDAKIKFGFRVPIIVYMGGFTSNKGGATLIEKKYRKGVAMIDRALLAEDMDRSSLKLKVKPYKEKEFPILASTADISSPKDTKLYAFWIRLGDELMKVIKVDKSSGEITIKRGFENTHISSHKKGARIFVPTYVGNRNKTSVRKSNSWPGGPDYLRYVMEPRAIDAQKYKADLIIELMKTGYDGAWLDTFQPKMGNRCDPTGRQIDYAWDFKEKKQYNWDSKITALQEMLRGIRRMVKKGTGKEPFLAANTIAHSHSKPGMEKLISSPGRPSLLDGYCFEDAYISPFATRKEGSKKLNASFHIISGDRWLGNIKNLRDRARKGLMALPMMGPAGYVAAYINPSLKNYDQLIRFSWCSFLLSVTKKRVIPFGLPLLIIKEKNETKFLPLPDLFYYPIGDPVDDKDIETCQIKDSTCYMRKFKNGLVIVNSPEVIKKQKGKYISMEPGRKSESVLIPEGYYNPATGKTATHIDLVPGDGILLLKR